VVAGIAKCALRAGIIFVLIMDTKNVGTGNMDIILQEHMHNISVLQSEVFLEFLIPCHWNMWHA